MATTLTREQSLALIAAARRVIQWRDNDTDLIDSLSDIPANEERHFDEDYDIYQPLRDALLMCGVDIPYAAGKTALVEG